MQNTGRRNVNPLYFPDSTEIAFLKGLTLRLSEINKSKRPLAWWCQGGGDSFTFGTRVLIWGLPFDIDEIYLGSEILRAQMCYMWSEIWGRLDFVGCDVSSMSLSKPFSWYQVCFRNWTTDYLGSLKKLVWLFGVLRKLLDISNPRFKSWGVSPSGGDARFLWPQDSNLFMRYRHCSYLWPAVTEIIQFFPLSVTSDTCSKTWLKTGEIRDSEHFEILGSKHSLI